MRDYIKVSRSMLDWEWYSDINTSRLFIHMLLKANWKDGNFKGTTVPRGSFVSSVRKLADETSLTEREVRTAINHLKTTGEVTHKSTSKYSVFTVVNYDLYQSNDTQSVSQTTSERQSNDIQTTAIEEGKKIIIMLCGLHRRTLIWSVTTALSVTTVLMHEPSLTFIRRKDG